MIGKAILGIFILMAAIVIAQPAYADEVWALTGIYKGGE